MEGHIYTNELLVNHLEMAHHVVHSKARALLDMCLACLAVAKKGG